MTTVRLFTFSFVSKLVRSRRASMVAATSATAAALTLVTVVPNGALVAQQPTLEMRNGSNPVRMVGLDPIPPAPPQGAWGEVVMANSKWLVVQNHQGQQFPIAIDSIDKFLIRWPTDLGAVTEETVVEAIGVQVNATTIETDHVDIFEGAAKDLVSPTYLTLTPNKTAQSIVDPFYNRFMNTSVNGALNQQFGWVYPDDNGGFNAITSATRVHVVENATGNDPLSVNIGGGNAVTILGSGNDGYAITQVTKGDPGYAEKGDVVYLMPTDLTARTVVLSKLVLYKSMPLRDFKVPPPNPLPVPEPAKDKDKDKAKAKANDN